MRIRILALSGTLAASSLLTAPAMATETAPPDGSATVTTAPGPASGKFRNSCNPAKATLPAAVEGTDVVKPGARQGTALGLYVWHEAKGWRVRLTHNLPRVTANDASKPQLVEVRGRITSSRPISNVRTIRLEDRQRGEWVSVQRPQRKVMDFRFVNGGYIDGINFNAGCAGRLAFTAWQVTKVDGKVARTPLPIFVGGTPTAPPTVVTDATTPALAPNAPADVSRVVILRSPVTTATPAP